MKFALVSCSDGYDEVMSRRNYSQFCGLAHALDVVGERWTLLIVRELGSGPKRYMQHSPTHWPASERACWRPGCGNWSPTASFSVGWPLISRVRPCSTSSPTRAGSSPKP